MLIGWVTVGILALTQLIELLLLVFSKGYIGKKGENLATKQDMKDIQDVINASNEKSNAKMMALQKSIDEDMAELQTKLDATLAVAVRRIEERDDFQSRFIESSYTFITNVSVIYPTDVLDSLRDTDHALPALIALRRTLLHDYLNFYRDIRLFRRDITPGSTLDEIIQELSTAVPSVIDTMGPALNNLVVAVAEQKYYREAIEEYRELKQMATNNVDAQKRLEAEYCNDRKKYKEAYQQRLSAEEKYHRATQSVIQTFPIAAELWTRLADEIHKTQRDAFVPDLPDLPRQPDLPSLS